MKFDTPRKAGSVRQVKWTLERRAAVGLLLLPILFWLAVPAASEDSPAGSGNFETPGPVKAEDFLPKSAFTGKIFVEPRAESNGLQNIYRIKAGTEEYEVTGSAGAVQLLQELRAIDQLTQISSGKAIENGLKQSAKDTYKTGKEIVKDPVAAFKRVPEGASRFFGKVKGFFKQDQDDSEQKPSADETMKSILGVDDAKRKLAARLGVDVYSHNQVLQRELDRVASATAAGGLVLDVGTLPIGGAVGVGLTVIGIQQTVDDLINNTSQDDLQKSNRQKLSQLGANQDVISVFLSNPWYTLRQETVITAALAKAGVNPTVFLQTGDNAVRDADGRFFETVAELLAAYTQQGTPLQSLRLEDGLVCAIDRDGVLVVPVSLDYAIWTPSVAQRVDELADPSGENQKFRRIEIWTEGTTSDRVKDELTKRAIAFRHVSLIDGN